MRDISVAQVGVKTNRMFSNHLADGVMAAGSPVFLSLHPTANGGRLLIPGLLVISEAVGGGPGLRPCLI